MSKLQWFSDGTEMKTPKEVLDEAYEAVDEMGEVAVVWLDKSHRADGCWSMLNTTKAFLAEYLKKDMF